MRIPPRRPMARAVVALAATSLLVSACGAGASRSGGTPQGGGSTVGATADTIKIGTHMPLTGVAAPGYSEIPTGAKAYFDYVNAKGGVNGRKIEYTVRDDGYKPTETSQVTNQLVLQDQIFGMLGGLGTPTHSAVVDFLNEQKVPDLFVSSGALAWNQPQKYPFTFGWQPNYEVEGKIIGKYIAEKFPTAKVGLFLQGDDFGRDGAKGAKQFLARQVVAEVNYTAGNVDVGPQITELQAKGADFVVGFNVPSYTALSQLTAAKLNYKPKWFYSNVGSDLTLVGALLKNFSKGAVTDAGPLNGIYSTKYLPTVEDANNPWTLKFGEIWKANGLAGQPLSNFRIYGMAQAYTLVAAMQAAGKDITREGLVAAVENKGSSFKGPWLAPLEYSKDSHRGISGVQIVQVEGTAIKALTPIQTTSSDMTPITDYKDAPSAPTDTGIPNAG